MFCPNNGKVATEVRKAGAIIANSGMVSQETWVIELRPDPVILRPDSVTQRSDLVTPRPVSVILRLPLSPRDLPCYLETAPVTLRLPLLP